MNKALLVGINKYPAPNELNGCVNDVTDMAKFLVADCNFVKSDIRMLTDERATKNAIMDRLAWLLSGLRAGDRIFFHYSGHGAEFPIRNVQGDVTAVHDVICPVNFDWSAEMPFSTLILNLCFLPYLMELSVYGCQIHAIPVVY